MSSDDTWIKNMATRPITAYVAPPRINPADNDYLAGELYKQDQIVDAARATIKEMLRHRKPSRKMLQRALRILEGKPLK